MRSTAVLLTVASALALTACSGKTAIRGHLPREEQISAIEVGTSTRNAVIQLIGAPSTTGTFDDKVWYYIGRKTSQFAFLNEEITEQQVLAIYFDDRDVVQMVQRYDENDLRRVEMVDRTTPTVGREMSVLRQLLGNIGRFGVN